MQSKKTLCLYGGFGGVESLRDLRVPALQRTVLDGQQIGSVVSIGSSERVEIDGFVIQNGTLGISTGGEGAVHIAHNVLTLNANSAIVCGTKDGLIASNTICFNGHLQTDGAVILASNSHVSIVSNVIAWNAAPGTSCSYWYSAFNCLYQNEYGNDCGSMPPDGLLLSTPGFVDAARGDYRLRPHSPCINAGDRYWCPSDPDGTRPDMGAFPYFHIAAAKLLPDGSPVSLSSAVVTSGSDGTVGVFVQDLAGSAGIRVLGAGAAARGDTLDISGTVQTDAATGERFIQAESTSPTTPEEMPAALMVAGRWLGGGDFGDGEFRQPGVTGGAGLNTIGLLVRVAGRVTEAADSTFTVMDGSGVPVRVVLPASTAAPSAGAFVTVTGISSLWKDGGGALHPSVLCRSEEDVGVNRRGAGPSSLSMRFPCF